MDTKCKTCGQEMKEVSRETDVRGRVHVLLECTKCDRMVIRRESPAPSSPPAAKS